MSKLVPIKINIDLAVLVLVEPGRNLDAITEHVTRNANALLVRELRSENEHEAAYNLDMITTRHVGTVIATEADLPQAVEA